MKTTVRKLPYLLVTLLIGAVFIFILGKSNMLRHFTLRRCLLEKISATNDHAIDVGPCLRGLDEPQVFFEVLWGLLTDLKSSDRIKNESGLLLILFADGTRIYSSRFDINQTTWFNLFDEFIDSKMESVNLSELELRVLDEVNLHRKRRKINARASQ